MKVELKNIGKRYRNTAVLENIDLCLSGGEIFCLIGKNGVGKSTLMEIILTLTKPDEGDIFIDGAPLDGKNKIENELKKHTGASLNIGTLVEGLTVQEYLGLIAAIYGLDDRLAAKRIQMLTGYFFKPGEGIKKPIRYFSSGMKKKASLCAALIHNPDLLLLDEPFTFLDPAASSNLCKLLIELKQMGKTILISSHDLLYIDKIATNIGVLNERGFVFNDSYSNFKLQDNFFSENKLLHKVLAYDNDNLKGIVSEFTNYN